MVTNNAGSLDAQPTTSNVARFTKTITGLQPGVTYNVLVRAKKNGKYSDYTTYTYSSPETDKSGNNFTVSNSNTDIQLLGGGFAASLSTDPLPINIGKINVTDTITAGTGVIMNQYGLAGYKAGTKTFYINARTGDAYFGGTLTAATGTFAGTVSASAVISGSATFGSTTVTGAISSISTAQSTAYGAQSAAGNAYSFAATKLTKSANTIADSSNNITGINTNGITVYSGTGVTADANGVVTLNGARVQMNSDGIAAYNAGNQPTFTLLSSNGDASFSGTITGSIIQTSASDTANKIYISNNNLKLIRYENSTNKNILNFDISAGKLYLQEDQFLFDTYTLSTGSTPGTLINTIGATLYIRPYNPSNSTFIAGSINGFIRQLIEKTGPSYSGNPGTNKYSYNFQIQSAEISGVPKTPDIIISNNLLSYGSLSSDGTGTGIGIKKHSVHLNQAVGTHFTLSGTNYAVRTMRNIFVAPTGSNFTNNTAIMDGEIVLYYTP